MKMKIYIILILVIIFSCSHENISNEDKLTKANKHAEYKSIIRDSYILFKLDSITKIDSSLRIGNDASYKIFEEFENQTSIEDLTEIIKHHKNPVIRGYSYMALFLRSYKNAENLYRENFLKIKWLCVYDICYAYKNKEEFLKNLNTKLNRIQNIRKMKNQKLLSPEEEKDIQYEDRIKNEQKP